MQHSDGRTVEELVRLLTEKNNVTACGATSELADISQASPAVYPWLGLFFDLLKNQNSYVRNRGLTLIAKNARWDGTNQIDGRLAEYAALLSDEKPITVRQCVGGLAEIAAQKPALTERIIAVLTAVDPYRYADSMAPLIEKDVLGLLKKLSRESAPAKEPLRQ